MPHAAYLPHIDILLRGMRISRERLNSRSKIAVDAKLLRALIEALVRQMPFDETFYLSTYPDLAQARLDGTIKDAHAHFAETGFFEGRVGAPMEVDAGFYMREYPDVAHALQEGAVASATEHYVKTGAAEGRLPNPAAKQEIEAWMRLLREPA